MGILATTLGWGTVPLQFYDMRTRIMILIAIIGLAVIWVGAQMSERTIALLGIVIVLIGIVGSHYSFKNKKGMGWLRRL